jgi:hypothetical protein
MPETRREKCLRVADDLRLIHLTPEPSYITDEAAALLLVFANEVCETCRNARDFNIYGWGRCPLRVNEPVRAHDYCDEWEAKPPEAAKESDA